MTKILFRYFLSLSFLLFSGYTHLYSHAEEISCEPSSIDLPARTFHTGSASAEQTIFSAKTFASSEREKVSFIDVTEVREDKKDKHELISAKKRRALDNYFASIFCVRTRVHLVSYVREILSFSKHFSDLSSNRRHLIFQLFLI